MKRKYIQPVTITNDSHLKQQLLQGTPTLPVDHTKNTDESLIKREGDECDNAFWGENIW